VNSIIGPVDFDHVLTADLLDEPFEPPGQPSNH